MKDWCSSSQMISKEAEREAHEQGEIIVRSPKLDEMAN
jgi:hypothetical protein